jgi:hypothetical protein
MLALGGGKIGKVKKLRREQSRTGLGDLFRHARPHRIIFVSVVLPYLWYVIITMNAKSYKIDSGGRFPVAIDVSRVIRSMLNTNVNHRLWIGFETRIRKFWLRSRTH